MSDEPTADRSFWQPEDQREGTTPTSEAAQPPTSEGTTPTSAAAQPPTSAAAQPPLGEADLPQDAHWAPPQYWTAQPTYPPSTYWTPPPPGAWLPSGSAPKPNHRKAILGSVAAAAVVAVTAGAVGVSVGRANRGTSQQTALTAPNSQTNPFSQNGEGGGLGQSGGGQFGWSNPLDGSGSGSSGSSGSSTTTTATAAQQVGVVDINTVLDYGTGKAAGTGMVLASSGEILTNNHVIDGSTSISVTVVTTGKTYTATVVGTDPTDDVAVLQLKDASGLAIANLGDSTTVAVGDSVTGVGNAGGTGGTPSAAKGTVTALNQSITASDSDGSNSERLTGMIQVNAAIAAGDSGGPLYNTKNQVIGIDTAASSGLADTTGFAIPIAKATSIAQKILSGTETSTIHIGYPAFLGVQLSSAHAGVATGGVPVAGVVTGSAAAKAGIVAGDNITAVNGTSVADATALSAALAKHNPGDQVTIKWTDSAGESHTATVTLGTGPAD
jgi:S1-C subfamily serine protease